jgi:hypothetical protein
LASLKSTVCTEAPVIFAGVVGKRFYRTPSAKAARNGTEQAYNVVSSLSGMPNKNQPGLQKA